MNGFQIEDKSILPAGQVILPPVMTFTLLFSLFTRPGGLTHCLSGGIGTTWSFVLCRILELSWTSSLQGINPDCVSCWHLGGTGCLAGHQANHWLSLISLQVHCCTTYPTYLLQHSWWLSIVVTSCSDSLILCKPSCLAWFFTCLLA